MTPHILQQIVLGDQAAFAELYMTYRSSAIRFCISLLKDEEEAENMVHEVFLKIWDRRQQINPELNFHSYLFTCLRNATFDYLKKVEKDQLLRERYWQRMQSFREDEGEEEERRMVLLEEAVNSLSAKRKQVLKLNVEQGKSYQEIAELLCISKNTVKNQLVKARQYLREKVDLATL